MKTKDKWEPVRIESAMQSHPLVKLTLADGITSAYIEMNGRTYYIDDSTGEAIMDNWVEGEPQWIHPWRRAFAEGGAQ